jgi:hypothetical protein
LQNPNELERYISIYGQDANVFIVAYSGKVGRDKINVKFEQFLNDVAPYANEKQLENFLIKKEGISTDHIIYKSEEESIKAFEISKKLQQAYDEDIKPGYISKSPLLIEHEANQLAKLVFDLEQGTKAIFVTADLRLRRLASDSIFGNLGSAILPHRGLIQLIDLLLGVKTDPTSMTRLIWGGGFDNQTEAIYNYFTNIALKFYDVAYSMALPNVLNEMAEKISRTAKNQKIDITAKNPSEHPKTIRFMDRFEDEFYVNMANAVKNYYPENPKEIDQIRRNFLEEKIEVISEQIKYLERLLENEKNNKKIGEIRFEIKEQNLQLSHFKSECKKMKK